MQQTNIHDAQYQAVFPTSRVIRQDGSRYGSRYNVKRGGYILTLGILEDHHLEHVPGTAVMNDASQELGGVDTSRLKHGRGRDAHIVLVPQPSNDPNDPLNWPQWKKELIIILVSGAALMATCIYCTILPATLILAEVFNESITAVSNSTGAHVMAIGCVTFFTSASAKKWGKRPVFLASILCMTLSCVWGAASKSWGSYFAARVFQGMGVAPVETLVTAMVGGMTLSP